MGAGGTMERHDVKDRPGRFTVVLLSILLGVYGVFCVLWVAGEHALYFELMHLYGFFPYDWPFLDLSNVPEAVRCHALGYDVLQSNPCDALGRTLSYSPLWLYVTPNFLSPDRVGVAGLVLGVVVLVLISVVARPRNLPEMLVLAGAGLSTATAFALERGNVDLLILVMVIVAALLWGGGTLARCCGYLVCLLAGLLKFYPLALLLLVLRERPRDVLLAGTVFVVVLGAFLIEDGHDVLAVLDHVARPSYFGDAFGAKNLPAAAADGLALLTGGAPGVMLVLTTVIVLAMFVAMLTRVLRRMRAARFMLDLSRLDIRLLIVGAVLVEGCFFAGQSVGYRGIFLLMLLPGLLTLYRATSDRSWRRVVGFTIAAILGALWVETPRFWFTFAVLSEGVSESGWARLVILLNWYVREMVWWWIISVLVGITMVFILKSPLIRWLPHRQSLQEVAGEL